LGIDVLDACRLCAKKRPNQEACGLIVKEYSRLKFIECDNLHSDPAGYFLIDPLEIISHDTQYIFHSHWNGDAKPSSFDTKSAKELCIPFLIYSLIEDDFYLYDNIGV
tara:strand:+ start:1143 stop:1466 length:324 start_codon:yes stop_codon:yes gene_type:complete